MAYSPNVSTCQVPRLASGTVALSKIEQRYVVTTIREYTKCDQEAAAISKAAIPNVQPVPSLTNGNRGWSVGKKMPAANLLDTIRARTWIVETKIYGEA